MATLAKWSVADYHGMVEAGILQERRVELLAGDVVEMSPETPLHYATAKRGARYLEALLQDKADVRFNGPITLADSEPEPDIAIVHLPETNYLKRHPLPQDIFWIIEVANTSLKKDLEVKPAIYATASIPEYWVINLVTPGITVFRHPQADHYTEEQHYEAGAIQPLAFADIAVSVNRLIAQTSA
ncbi:MAG: Uma2 family endonuclease [Cyanobacteria bacterium J06638_28]